MQEQDRLGMKSQLEGAELGLPLQGGAWGHDPGSTQPRREDAFREEAEGKTRARAHTHTERREGGKKTNSRRPKLAWSAVWAADSWGPRPRCRQLTAWRSKTLLELPPRGPVQVVPGYGQEREAGPGVPRGPQLLGSTDQVRYRERGN